jgi:hypothetical protein
LEVVKGFRGVLRTAGASEALGFDRDSSSLLLVWAEVIDMLSGAVKSITLVGLEEGSAFAELVLVTCEEVILKFAVGMSWFLADFSPVALANKIS